MVTEIKQGVVYSVKYSHNHFIGFPNGLRSTYIRTHNNTFEEENTSGDIDYRTNTSITKRETYEATEEETQWFLECHRQQKFIPLDIFKKLHIKKEFPHYN